MSNTLKDTMTTSIENYIRLQNLVLTRMDLRLKALELYRDSTIKLQSFTIDGEVLRVFGFSTSTQSHYEYSVRVDLLYMSDIEFDDYIAFAKENVKQDKLKGRM